MGDETDALATLYFLNDCTQRFHGRAQLKDEENPIAKLRFLDIRQGKLPSGMPIEDVLAARPVIKRLNGGAITFYPPTYRPNSYFRRDKPGMWGLDLRGCPRARGAQRAVRQIRGLVQRPRRARLRHRPSRPRPERGPTRSHRQHGGVRRRSRPACHARPCRI
jgi:hypothetical protein